MGAHLPSGKGRGRRAPMAEINVTPLVDVMLVLLIIFMVTAPLMTAGVEVNLPESRAGAIEQEQEPVQISIDDKGQIFIGEELVSEDALPQRLQAIAANPDPDGKPPMIFLRADTTLTYGRPMALLGELNRMGLNRVSLLTTSKSNP